MINQTRITMLMQTAVVLMIKVPVHAEITGTGLSLPLFWTLRLGRYVDPLLLTS